MKDYCQCPFTFGLQSARKPSMMASGLFKCERDHPMTLSFVCSYALLLPVTRVLGLPLIRGNQMGVQGVGRGRRQVQLPHLPPHLPRDELDGGLHFGHHALGFRETLQVGLAEMFMLGNGADRVDVALDIPGNELAVAPYAALHVDKVVGVADGPDTLGDQLALPSEALVFVARGGHVLRHLLQARCRLGRATWITLCRRSKG